MRDKGRRSFLRELGGLAIAGVASVNVLGASASARAAEPEAGPVRRVMVIGSSMIVGALGRGIADSLAERGYETERRSKSASGLSRPDFYDWPKEVRDAMRSFEPDATVVMFGGNDAQGIWTRSDPKWIRFTESHWPAGYAARVAELADLLTEGGQRLCWLGAPRMGIGSLDDRMQLLNALYAQQMAIRPNGKFIPTAPALADDRGRYARSLRIDGDMVEVRTHDGVHVTMAGARRVVRYVTPKIDAFLSEPLVIDGQRLDGRCLPPSRR